MANFCKSCHFYEKNIFTRVGESFGLCHNVSVANKIAIDGSTVLGEDGSVYTEEHFGCVYWRQDGGSLIDIRDALNIRQMCDCCGKHKGDCQCSII